MAWKLLFPEGLLLDMGLRWRGFVKHLWMYGVCLAIVVPVMLLVAQQPDFGSYYPFYKQSSRSLFDFMDVGGDVLGAVLRARTILSRLDGGGAPPHAWGRPPSS